MSVEVMRAELTGKMRSKLHEARAIITAAQAAKRGMTPDETTRFNLLRFEAEELKSSRDSMAPDTQAVRSAIAGGESPRAARYNDAEQRAVLFGGQEVRAMLAGTLASGGALVPAELAQFVIDGLHAEAIGLKAGVRFIQTDRASLEMPLMRTDPAGAWISEGDEITAADAPTGTIIAAAHKFAVRTEVSNDLIQFSNPSVIELLFQRLTRAAALAIDAGIFQGTGLVNQVAGLAGRSNIPYLEMGANGAAFTDLDKIADAIGTLAEADATASAIVMAPRTWKSLSKLKEVTGASNKPLLQESAGSAGQGVQRRIYGLPVLLSSQLSVTETQGSASNASSVYVAQWDQVVVTRHGVLRLERDSSRLFHKDQSEVRLVAYADVSVLNPDAVVRIKGVIP